jgi:PAS domain S-box-containing protein
MVVFGVSGGRLTAPAKGLSMQFSSARRKGLIGNEGVRVPVVPLLVAGGYFVAATAGLALGPDQGAVASAWPASAVLLAGLLVSPAQCWWRILLAVLPVHFVVLLASGVPFAPGLAGFGRNCGEAVAAAAGLHWILRERIRFDDVRHVGAFLGACVVAGPMLACALDVALAPALDDARQAWPAWQARLVPEMAAMLVLVPVLADSPAAYLARLRRAPLARHVEGALLAAALLAAAAVFGQGGARLAVALVLGALPPLLWAALRFGPPVTSALLLLVATFAVAAAARAAEPGGAPVSPQSIWPVQLWLAGLAAPLLLLAAAMRERAAARRLLHDRDDALALARAQAALHAGAAHMRAMADAESGRRAELERRIAQRTGQLRHARAAARASHRRFARVFGASPVAMALGSGIDGVIWDVNESWQRLFGYRRADVIGRTAQELGLFADGAAPDRNAVDELYAPMLRRDGARLDIVLRGVRIDDGPDPCVLTILRDETEQRRRVREARLQREQLTHLSRVVVLGELCGGIAHELNQPLAAILANAQAGRRWLARVPGVAPALAEILDDIIGADQRAAAIIRHLRALFLQGQTTLLPLDLNEVVREALLLARGSLAAHRVQVETALDPDAGAVRGDRVQLQQVLLNLLVNACDAMSAIAPAQRCLRVASGVGDPAQAWLEVSDCGPGIPAGTPGQVFDFFYTTKPHGLGFGLAVSRAIIEAHGGRIEAANRAAGGARFRITLPVTAGGQDEQ